MRDFDGRPKRGGFRRDGARRQQGFRSENRNFDNNRPRRNFGDNNGPRGNRGGRGGRGGRGDRNDGDRPQKFRRMTAEEEEKQLENYFNKNTHATQKMDDALDNYFGDEKRKETTTTETQKPATKPVESSQPAEKTVEAAKEKEAAEEDI